MPTLAETLATLKAGDVIRVMSTRGARAPFLIEAVDHATFRGETMTSHAQLLFDRATGVGKYAENGPVWYVQSVATPPSDWVAATFRLYNIRLVAGKDFAQRYASGAPFDQADMDALEALGEYFDAHPLMID